MSEDFARSPLKLDSSIAMIGLVVAIASVVGSAAGYLAGKPGAGPAGPEGPEGPAGPAGLEVSIGTIVPFGGELSDTRRLELLSEGWVPCDGGFLSRHEFPELFEVIGTAWGVDGSTTFNVPDLRGRFVRGVDGGAGRDPDRDRRLSSREGGNAGNTVGSAQGSATAAPSRPFRTGNNEGSHEHSFSVRGATFNDGTGAASLYLPHPERGTRTTSEESKPHIHVVSSGGDAETRPRNVNVHWLIKARRQTLPGQSAGQ